jgi:RNA polymerase sigma factor (sigma-70 family)
MGKGDTPDFLRAHPELLAGFRRGDDDVMALIYDEYEPRLHGMLSHGYYVPGSGQRVPPLKSPDDRADVIQLTMMHGLSEKVRLAYDPERDLWPLLMIIARNEMVSRHRKHGREIAASGHHALEEVEYALGETEVAQEPDKLDPKAEAVLEKYLASLSATERALFLASYEGDVSQRDLAEQMGITRGKVRWKQKELALGLYRRLKQAGLELLERLTPAPANEERPSHG